MDINALRSLLTVVSLIIFVGIVAYAYSRRKRQDFEEASYIPLREQDDV